MKLLGYEYGKERRGSPLGLAEVSLWTSPVELRAIAKVLIDLAVEMEAEDFDHVHLADRLHCLADGPELIVAKAK